MTPMQRLALLKTAAYESGYYSRCMLELDYRSDVYAEYKKLLDESIRIREYQHTELKKILDENSHR